MSSSLVIYMKTKTDDIKKGNRICLLDMSTTPARELMNENVLPQSIDSLDDERVYKKLTIDQIRQVINYYTFKIEEMKKQIQECNDEITILRENMLKTKSIEIYRAIEGDLENTKTSILECQSEIETYTEYQNLWSYSVLQVYIATLQNNGQWDFLNDRPVDDNGYELWYYLI